MNALGHTMASMTRAGKTDAAEGSSRRNNPSRASSFANTNAGNAANRDRGHNINHVSDTSASPLLGLDSPHPHPSIADGLFSAAETRSSIVVSNASSSCKARRKLSRPVQQGTVRQCTISLSSQAYRRLYCLLCRFRHLS
jgi:hypothetical protein